MLPGAHRGPDTNWFPWLHAAFGRGFDAVRNPIREDWSNGQTEGQIKKLKALKRAMDGRVGAELLCARVLPVSA